MASDITIWVTEDVEVSIVGGGTRKIKANQSGLTGSNIKIVGQGVGGVTINGVEDGITAIYKFADVPDDIYKLFVNNVERGSFGGSNGRWVGDASLGYLPLAGGTMTGVINMGNHRIEALADPDSNDDAIALGYADLRYILLTDKKYFWYAASGSNILIVDPAISVNDERHYNTVQAAINYAQEQTPSASSQWFIYIIPKKGSTGYVENVTLQAYVHLIGLGRVRIHGSMTGGNVNTKLENIFWLYTGNFTVENIRAFNCDFQTDDPEATFFTLTVGSGYFRNCGFFGTEKVTSSGNNYFIGQTFFNMGEQNASDKVIGVLSSAQDKTLVLTY